jgi:hypothetical protein
MIESAVIQAAKDRVPISQLFADFGYPVRSQWALCPFHNDSRPSCKVDDRYGNFRCWACGANGDHYDLIFHVRGQKHYGKALDELGGARPLSDAEKKSLAARHAQIEKEEKQREVQEQKEVQKIWREATQVRGTPVEKYLNNRFLVADPSWTFNIRYADLPFYGFKDTESREKSCLIQACPTMVAAIRDSGGNIIGIHRTFLAADGHSKLNPPGDMKRNTTKRILGRMNGGAIWLSHETNKVFIGEGIETTRAFQLMECSFLSGYGFAAAVSLFNMSGGSTESVAHPVSKEKRFPGPMPDMNKPGIILPKNTDAVGIIRDSDSDPYMTKAAILRAVRRFEREGKKIIGVMSADDGEDYNDMWVRLNNRESENVR